MSSRLMKVLTGRENGLLRIIVLDWVSYYELSFRVNQK
jgi:hypothetical protein